MKMEPGQFEFHLRLPYCGLSAGFYSAKIVVTEGNVKTLDAIESFRFRVSSDGGTADQNLFYQPREWSARRVSSAVREDSVDGAEARVEEESSETA